jgi:drug/metabolite transporter (DMT)-like permease
VGATVLAALLPGIREVPGAATVIGGAIVLGGILLTARGERPVEGTESVVPGTP